MWKPTEKIKTAVVNSKSCQSFNSVETRTSLRVHSAMFRIKFKQNPHLCMEFRMDVDEKTREVRGIQLLSRACEDSKFEPVKQEVLRDVFQAQLFQDQADHSRYYLGVHPFEHKFVICPSKKGFRALYPVPGEKKLAQVVEMEVHAVREPMSMTIHMKSKFRASAESSSRFYNQAFACSNAFTLALYNCVMGS